MAHRLPPAGSLQPPPSDFFAFYQVHAPEERPPQIHFRWPEPEPLSTTSCYLRPKRATPAKEQRSECCCCCCPKVSGGCQCMKPQSRSKPNQCGMCIYPDRSQQFKYNRYGVCVFPVKREENQCSCNKRACKKCCCSKDDTCKKPCDAKVTTRRRETVTTEESVTCCRPGKRKECITCPRCG